jgi:hypothetical protein
MSVGDLVSVGIFVVAVIAVFYVPINRAQRKLDKRVKQLQRDAQVAYEVASILGRSVIAVRNGLEFQSGLVERIWRGQHSEVQVASAMRACQTLIAPLERAVHEVALFSNDQARRISAIQQLSTRVGDYNSLELMRSLGERRPSDKYLKDGIIRLSKRLAAA